MTEPFEQGQPVRLVPCTVTQVSPLLITILGEPNVPAVKVAGGTYTLAAANALIVASGKPIVLPLG